MKDSFTSLFLSKAFLDSISLRLEQKMSFNLPKATANAIKKIRQN
jgi:hypothetical protein